MPECYMRFVNDLPLDQKVPLLLGGVGLISALCVEVLEVLRQ